MVKIVRTLDGSHTLFEPGLGEHYHSVNGAIQESDFIYINCGLRYSKADPVRIFEVGFGAGLNTLLSCIYASENNRDISYTSIEKYPVSEDIINSLNYGKLFGNNGKRFFEQIHKCRWDVPEKITGNFTLHKIKGDLITDDIPGFYDLIYFDAFAPDKQPEIWTDFVFKKISEISYDNAVLVTYTAKGNVKRALRLYGFKVNRLPGPPGKRHIIRAVKS
jgi:tRNA U34 5-methylaminomethyl-2-thiouridine-forming methyltransferase MnmC